MEFDPVEAMRVATELDSLADRLEAELRSGAPARAVAAPGLDEVSLRAAATLQEVSGSFDTSADSGILELRRLAASLRSQSRELSLMDSANAADLGAMA
ncbi:PE family protein [Nocardia takedensis]|uniref:PE family protein n=1 Tax=Nocardia takedensis TaxID=259390 RepID=UPI000316615A|nr:PE domain-containing protein [Nocardia takedensis]